VVRRAWCVVATGLGVLAACGLAAEPAPGETQAVKARGKLVVVSFPHQDSEFMSVNLERGPMKKVGGVDDFKGMDVDIMAGFASTLGVTLEIRPIATPGYGELIPSLLAGDGDVIASSFTITPARRAQVDFSIPYFESPELVVMRKDAAISSVADLKGRKGAAVKGSAQADLLRSLGVAEADLVLGDFTRDGYQAVAEGRADFAVVDGGSLDMVLGDFPDLKAGFPVGEGVKYGFAVRKGSDLLPVLDKYLRWLRATGKLEELKSKWVKAPSR
jgi:ABC-type amino acid transport substrate-binding protein